jgi:hypothetical protein
VLVAAVLLVPLIMGLMSLGFALSRSLQVAHLTRDVGRMMVRGVDFSASMNQDLVTGSASRPNLPPLASGLGMVANNGSVTGVASGNGVVVLSTFTRMSTSCNCANAGQIVLSRRIVIGNRTLFSSSYGAPSPSALNTSTGVVANYANEVTARAANFSGTVNLSDGEFAYLVETYFRFPDLAIPGVFSSPGVTWMAVF